MMLNLTSRDLIVIELALINRTDFLSKNIAVVPGAPEKIMQASELRNKIIKASEKSPSPTKESK